MKKIITLALFLVSSLYIVNCKFYIPAASATDASSSASPSASLQDKLKALQADIASRANRLKDEISQKLQNQAYLGAVQSKTTDSLVLSTRSDPKTVRLDEFTLYSYQGKKTTLASLKTDDYVAALGDLDDKELLVAKKIIKLTPPKTTKQVFWGSVVKVAALSLTVQNKAGETKTIQLTKNTSYQRDKSETTLNEISVKQSVVVIVNEDVKDKSVTASFVYIYPNH